MEDNDCTYGEDTGALPGGTFTMWAEDKVFAWSDSPTPARFASDLLCVAAIMATATLVGFAFLPFGMETCVVIICSSRFAVICRICGHEVLSFAPLSAVSAPCGYGLFVSICRGV